MESVTARLKELLDKRTPFVPVGKAPVVKRNLKLEFAPDEYARMGELARKHNVSLKSFAKQAIQFAIERLERGPR